MHLTLQEDLCPPTHDGKELLESLDAYTAHANELAQPLPQELTPLEGLKGSVKCYDRPTDPVWEEFLVPDE